MDKDKTKVRKSKPFSLINVPREQFPEGGGATGLDRGLALAQGEGQLSLAAMAGLQPTLDTMTQYRAAQEAILQV